MNGSAFNIFSSQPNNNSNKINDTINNNLNPINQFFLPNLISNNINTINKFPIYNYLDVNYFNFLFQNYKNYLLSNQNKITLLNEKKEMVNYVKIVLILILHIMQRECVLIVIIQKEEVKNLGNVFI